ncbi:MAG: alkaline phosphatase [Akkermansia sp.]|nr:alkaline phosphatase [Akkermansia sp.]
MFKHIGLSVVLLVSGCVAAPVQVVRDMPQHEVVPCPAAPERGAVRNVIFMIGDGMGAEHVWAAWLCNKGKLNITGLTDTAFSYTASANKTITDSAAGGTALACGEKTNNGMLGQAPDGRELSSLAARFRERGKATGLVVTKAITDATPAAFYAHTASRDNRAEIAEGLTTAGFDVVLGGGAGAFSDEQMARMRKNGADVELFASGDCPPASKRGDLLPRNVERALARLEKSDKGFFLMVEGSSIDMAGHDNNLDEVVREVLDFDQAVGVVLQWMKKHPDTLLVVTADHQTGGLSLLDGSRDSGWVKGVFTTWYHSGVAVPIYAAGAGASAFRGVMDNTRVPQEILRAATQK